MDGMLLCVVVQAAKWGVSRQEQDEFAALSHQRAGAAHKAGIYKDEIVAVDGNTAENGVKVTASSQHRQTQTDR